MLSTTLPTSNYDKTKFKEFLTGHCLPQLKDKSGVLVLGLMGAGKSTTIAIQLGAAYERDPDGEGYKLISSVTYTPQTSDGYTSKTLNIGAYEDVDEQLMYLDTAGLNEDRGKEEALWTKNNLSLLFSIIKGIKSVVVVIDYGATFGGRAKEFKELARNLLTITMGNKIFYNSMIFVVTNGYQFGAKISVPSLVGEVRKMLSEIEGQRKELISRLEINHPLKRIKIAANYFSKSTEIESLTFDINAVSEEDKNKLDTLEATKILLETFESAGEKIILIFPDGKLACQQFREKLLKKIYLTPTISQETLIDIKSRHMADRSLLLFEVLSSLASNYQSNLLHVANLIKRLNENFQGKKVLLDAAENDWESVKENLIRVKATNIKDKEVSLELKKDELERLQKSTNEMVHQEQHILKGRDSGFLGLRFFVGAARAEEQYVYDGQPFTKHKYEYEEEFKHFDAKETKYERHQGKLTIDFKSHNGCDLNLKVKVFDLEKNLPATKERISVLQTEIEDGNAEISSLQINLVSLKAVQSKEQLEREITKETDELQNELKETVYFFETPLRMGGQETEWHAVKGLEALLKLLHEVNAIPRDLSPAASGTLVEFLESCKKIQTGCENPYLKKLIPNLTVAQGAINILHREANPPSGNQGVLVYANLLTANIGKGFNALNQSSFFYNHQLELGFCAILAGTLLLWQESSSSPNFSRFSLANLLIISLITLGVFWIVSYSRINTEKTIRKAEENMREVKSKLNEVIDEIEKEGKILHRSTRDMGLFAIQRLTEKFNLDVKTDIKNVDGLLNVSGIHLG